MTAGRYVKNVISKEYEVTTFVQDVNFKALTGLARATKAERRSPATIFHLWNFGPES